MIRELHLAGHGHLYTLNGCSVNGGFLKCALMSDLAIAVLLADRPVYSRMMLMKKICSEREWCS